MSCDKIACRNGVYIEALNSCRLFGSDKTGFLFQQLISIILSENFKVECSLSELANRAVKPAHFARASVRNVAAAPFFDVEGAPHIAT